MEKNKASIALLQTPASIMNIDIHGGIERVELHQLEAFNRLGYRTELFVSKLIGAKTGVRQIRDFGYRNRYLQTLYYINFGIRNIRTTIYHGHYTPMLGLLFPRKSVIHFHGLGVSELPLYRHFARRFHRAHYVFCARWVLEDFRKLYPDIPNSQLHVVYNGVDSEAIRPGAGRNGPIKNVCFYTGWIPEKGIYEVLSAAEILSKQRSDFKIWYGGSAFSHYKGSKWGDAGEIDKKVREWAARLPCVELVGNIKRQDLPAFLAKMDIGLVPSTYADPFPLVPLEMMAAGLPVIAYDLGGLKEQVVDNVNGFLVENQRPDLIAQKLASLLDNPGRLEEMGRAAREHVKREFTWERHIEQLLEIYRLAIKANAGA
jgi:glycosyltransferase involved in cell wall biosynthesis